MNKIIKCHICKLNPKTCEEKCIDVEDVSELYQDGLTESDAIPKGYCTAHKCEYNPSGLQCVLDKCAFRLDN